MRAGTHRFTGPRKVGITYALATYKFDNIMNIILKMKNFSISASESAKSQVHLSSGHMVSFCSLRSLSHPQAAIRQPYRPPLGSEPLNCIRSKARKGAPMTQSCL